MDCLDAKLKLEPCAKGELSPVEKAELDRHVATCEGCRLELELTRAVLGSSSSDATFDDPSFDDPPLLDPMAAGNGGAPPDVESIPPEPSIEQERLPPPVPEGLGPPRVLTSQLPPEPEDMLDLASIHPSEAYDPGAIELPHTDPSPGSEDASGSGAMSTTGLPPEGRVSFADRAMDSSAMAGEPSSAGAVSAGAASGSVVPTGSGSTWDFEPVDVPRKAAPPEESLTFAKEALDRKRRSRSKGGKLLLWIVGAVGGVGLLGASVWMALALREPEGSREPANVPAVLPQPGAEPFPSTPTDSAALELGPAAGMTAIDATAAQGRVPAFLKAGPAGAGATDPPIVPPAPKPPAGQAADPTRSPGAGTAPVASKTPAQAEKRSEPAGGSAPTTVTFREDELMPAPRREPRILTVEPDAVPGSEPVDDPGPAQPEPGGREPIRSSSTAPIFVPPSSGTQNAPGGTSTKQPTEAAPTGPIGRLHLATVTAEKNKDLDGLRKLEESWKSLIQSTTGPDRARSKREYADCLWAIQKITSREEDRKEALAAYREYVLHAPAGGADPRTVGRMRQLEDILTDSR